jgi:hypothetical protein
MLHDFLQGLKGFEHFGMISMFLFLGFFILVLIHTYSINKKDVEEFSRMPFDDSTKDFENNN